MIAVTSFAQINLQKDLVILSLIPAPWMAANIEYPRHKPHRPLPCAAFPQNRSRVSAASASFIVGTFDAGFPKHQHAERSAFLALMPEHPVIIPIAITPPPKPAVWRLQ
jgi:hypothetical protein